MVDAGIRFWGERSEDYLPSWTNADALSRNPVDKTDDTSVRVCSITGNRRTIQEILAESPAQGGIVGSLGGEQRKDPELRQFIEYLEKGVLPEDPLRIRELVAKEPFFTMIDDVVYRVEGGSAKRMVAPKHLQNQLIAETHGGPLGGHFSGDRLFRTLSRHWWWERMYAACSIFVKNCPECLITTGGGRNVKPPLHPIPPVKRPFEIVGVDIMELPVTSQGNRYVLVFQQNGQWCLPSQTRRVRE